MKPADWCDAHLLLAFLCPCEARRTIADGIASTPVDRPDTLDRWVRLDASVNAILASVTVQ